MVTVECPVEVAEVEVEVEVAEVAVEAATDQTWKSSASLKIRLPLFQKRLPPLDIILTAEAAFH